MWPVKCNHICRPSSFMSPLSLSTEPLTLCGLGRIHTLSKIASALRNWYHPLSPGSVWPFGGTAHSSRGAPVSSHFVFGSLVHQRPKTHIRGDFRSGTRSDKTSWRVRTRKSPRNCVRVMKEELRIVSSEEDNYLVMSWLQLDWKPVKTVIKLVKHAMLDWRTYKINKLCTSYL